MDRLEGSQREDGSSIRRGGAGNEGFDGLGVQGIRHNGRDRKGHGGGVVPGCKQLQWSGVKRGGGLTNSLNSIEQGTKAGITRSNFKLKKDIV